MKKYLVKDLFLRVRKELAQLKKRNDRDLSLYIYKMIDNAYKHNLIKFWTKERLNNLLVKVENSTKKGKR